MLEAMFGSCAIQSEGELFLFDSPTRTYSANRLEEILPLLTTVEAAARSGRWVALMLTYESAAAFDSALKTQPAGFLPLAWAALFDGPSYIKSDLDTAPYKLAGWEPRITRSQYIHAINRIRDLIAKGDTYQVNYTFPLVTTFRGDPKSWYRDLCNAQRAEYCAYIDVGRFKILSLSPELFFERTGDLVRTKPMKGTISRGRWAAEDSERAQMLAESPKEQAENVMIVDLLRNDLGKVSVPGSVRVSKLFETESFETLWQMTSTVESRLETGVSFGELVAALFPCGSITGAPKIRTMEIIRELEAHPRGVYTGTIGFIRPGGDCVFNVAIRTIVLDSETGTATFGVGGGITFDSTAEREYEECLLKSSFLHASADSFQLLESLLLETGEFFLLQRHLDRLSASAKYFGFHLQEKQALSELACVAGTHPQGRWKVRLLLSKNGDVHSEAVELRCTGDDPRRVALAGKPIDSTHRFLFHKTTNRAVYDEALSNRPDCDDVILWNERGEITESTVANVVVPFDGQLCTPPQESGLLAGTFRGELLAEGKIRERVIHIEELRQIKRFFLINSVRKWVRGTLLE